MIAGLLLAAGRSTRFGDDKLLATLRGRPVIRWSAEALAAAVDATYVVVPRDATALRTALLGIDVTFVEHAARDAGLGSSIAAGVAAIPPDSEAVVLALADQPFVSVPVILRLREAWRTSRAPAVVPRYRDGRGHPILFDRRCVPALLALTTDRGARSVLDSMGETVAWVEIDESRPADVDTPDALRALAREHERVSGGEHGG